MAEKNVNGEEIAVKNVRDVLMWEPGWWLPLESLWSAWNHFLDANTMSFTHLFARTGLLHELVARNGVARNGVAFAKDALLRGFTKKERECLYGLLGKRPDRLPFEKLKAYDSTTVQTKLEPAFEQWTLRICPVCMSLGYHSILHQLKVLDKCFIHNAEPLITTDIVYKVARDAAFAYGKMEKTLEAGTDSIDFPDIFTYISNIKKIRDMLPDLSHLDRYKEINTLIPWSDISEHPAVSEKMMDFILHGNYTKKLVEFSDGDREETGFLLFQTHVAPILFQGLSMDSSARNMDGLWDSYVQFVFNYSRKEKISLFSSFITRSLFEGLSDKEIVSILKHEHPDKERSVRINAKAKLLEAMSACSPYEYDVIMGKICWLKKTLNYITNDQKPTLPFIGNATYYDATKYWCPFEHDPCQIETYRKYPRSTYIKDRRFDSMSLVFVTMFLDQIGYMMDQLDKYISESNISSVDEIELQNIDMPVYLVCTMKGEEPVYKILRL